MNLFSIIIYTFIVFSGILIYFFYKELKLTKKGKKFWSNHPKSSWGMIGILSIGIVLALYCRFIEPYWINIVEQSVTLTSSAHSNPTSEPIKIVFISDLHVGEHKKSGWIQKVVSTIKKINPDLVLLGGDYVANDGTNARDESEYLMPLKGLVGNFPIYYIMGNHEYGLYSRGFRLNSDQSTNVKNRMEEIGIPLLRNDLACPEIKGRALCIFGNDDVYTENRDFTALEHWTTSTPLILVSHNPDAILYWPKELKKPDLELAGHTHGGQIYLPFIGPLGRVEVFLGAKYYRGLNYYNEVPIYTSIGLGESGGPIRFWSRPEITVLKIQFK
jgi:predicted MPP superfamily phosphohydrolase